MDTSQEKNAFIGFPPPLLGERPLRMPVLYSGDGLLAVDRPAGITGAAHSWYPHLPDLMEAINTQARSGKPELARLGVGEVKPVVMTDAECAGVTLYASGDQALEFYRNQYGSGQMTLRFVLLAHAQAGEDVRVCDLPLARHRGGQPRMVVSHTTGKQARTEFRMTENIGAYSLWEASTAFARMHQVRIHALESGLGVVGDTDYSREPPVFLSRIKPGYAVRKSRAGDEERPLYPCPAMYLQSVELETQTGESLRIAGEAPTKFEVMLKHLRRHSTPARRR